LTPRLARSVGFLPVFFPPERRLGHAAVQRQPGPVDAAPVVVGQQAGLPQGREDAGFDPLLEAVVDRGAGQEAGGVQGLPLAAGAQDVQDGLHAEAIVGPRPAAAEAVRVRVLGQQEFHALPEVVGDTPLIRDVAPGHRPASASRQLLTKQVQLHPEVVASHGLFG
jgi:hypothetical protein